jgi:hypothetical protein
LISQPKIDKLYIPLSFFVLNDVHEMVSCTATLFSLKSQTLKFKGVKKKDIEKPNREEEYVLQQQ